MAIDIIARGLASSLLGENGKIASEKMPTLSTPEDSRFYAVGALTDPSLIEGKTAEEILLMMLFGVINPTLIDPTLSIEFTNQTSYIIGRDYVLEGTITFDRGQIKPAYGTSGYRTGLPTYFTIADTWFSTSNVTQNFSISFKPTLKENIISYSVDYSAGEQPVNSIGAPVGMPLPAGTLSNTAIVKAVYAIYNGKKEEIEFSWFEEEDGEGYAAIFASEASSEKQSFAIADDLKVIGVKGFDTLTKQWTWLGGEDAETSLTFFDTTDMTGDSLGETIHYILYTYNHLTVGERELRIYVE